MRSIKSWFKRWLWFVLFWVLYGASDTLRPRRPIGVRFVIKEFNMGKGGVIVLPPVKSGDGVQTRQLSWSFAGSSDSVSLPASALESPPIPLSGDGLLTGTLVDIDQAGNASEPASFEFNVDVTAPHKPGAISLRLVDIPNESSIAEELGGEAGSLADSLAGESEDIDDGIGDDDDDWDDDDDDFDDDDDEDDIEEDTEDADANEEE